MLLPLSKSLLATDIILPILATTAVILRIFARRIRRVSLLWDDYLIIIALIITLGVCGTGWYTAGTNLIATPIAQLSPARFEIYQKLFYANVPMCHAIYGLIKISVVLFYKRFFITPQFTFRSNILIAIDIAWMIAAIVGTLFSAWPIDKFWSTFTTDMNYPGYLLSIVVIDLVIDVVTLCLPLPEIAKLRMSKRRKISLIAIFSLGWFCIIASAVRIYYIARFVLIFNGKLPMEDITPVNTWDDIWATIEACVSIIAACLPTLAPLFKPRLSSDSQPGGSFPSLKKNLFRFSSWMHKSGSSNSSSMDSYTAQHGWQELHQIAVENSATGKPASEDNIELIDRPSGIHVHKAFIQYDEV